MRAEANEYALFGIRGDGKTIGTISAILAHAQTHKEKGFGLPVPWLALRDSFANHKVTTIESLHKPLWGGRWRIYDDSHLAAFRQGPGADDLVLLKLAGSDNEDSLNKLRQEVCGVWAQEAAPVEESGGISYTSYSVAISSKGRIPTYHSPTILDLNYPDEDHWVWQRFVANPQPGTKFFRIPPKENKHVDLKYWDDMEISLADRPDLRRRLLEGQPGVIMKGQQVAVGFREDLHVARQHLEPIKGEPLLFGQDGGHTPTCVVGQAWRGYIRVYASLTIDRGGMRQLYEREVMPWMRANAGWALNRSDMVVGTYDPSMPDDESDSDRNPIDVCQEMVGGYWGPGPTVWESRKGVLITALNRHVGPGEIALQIDPSCRGLIAALSGRWHYPQNRLGEVSRDAPAKPNHPHEDYGDSFIYFLCTAMPELDRPKLPDQGRTVSWDPRFEETYSDVAQLDQFDSRLR